MFTEAWGSEEGIDALLVGVRGFVGEEGIDLGGRWREAGQGQGDPAKERHAVGRGRRLQTDLGGLRGHEMIERILGPSRIDHFGQWVGLRCDEAPVPIIFRPLLDPAG